MSYEFIKKIDIRTKEDSNDEYHGDKKFISSTGMKKMKKSPAHFKEEIMKHSDALDFGTAYHTYILEPEKFNHEIAVLDENNKPFPNSTYAKKENKEWKAEFYASNFGKTIITKDWMNTIEAMGKKLKSHRYAYSLVNKGVAEKSFYAEIELYSGHKIHAKVRPDYLKEKNKVIVDLKTARDASQRGFMRAAADLDYHISAALYKLIIDKYFGDSYSFRFVFLAQEKEPPYAFNIFNADTHFLGQGLHECEQLMMLFAECVDRNEWPAYQIWSDNEFGVNELKLPTYAFNDYDWFEHSFKNKNNTKNLTNGR